MKPARLIILGVALAAGDAAATSASGRRQPEPPEPPAPPLATVDAQVAKHKLGVGQVVGSKDIAWQTWPAAAAGKAIKEFEGPPTPESGDSDQTSRAAVNIARYGVSMQPIS